MGTIKICPDCGRAYAEGSEPTKVWGHNFKNSITKCNHIHEFEVDDDMISILVVLWEKGYTTTYSCSGHFVHTQYGMGNNICSTDQPDTMYITVNFKTNHISDLITKLINFRFKEFSMCSLNLSMEWDSDSSDKCDKTFTIRSSDKYATIANHNYESEKDYDYATYAIARYELLSDLMRFAIRLPDIYKVSKQHR